MLYIRYNRTKIGRSQRSGRKRQDKKGNPVNEAIQYHQD